MDKVLASWPTTWEPALKDSSDSMAIGVPIEDVPLGAWFRPGLPAKGADGRVADSVPKDRGLLIPRFDESARLTLLESLRFAMVRASLWPRRRGLTLLRFASSPIRNITASFAPSARCSLRRMTSSSTYAECHSSWYRTQLILLQLFWTHFHSTLPFIHLPSFDPRTTVGPLLVWCAPSTSPASMQVLTRTLQHHRSRSFPLEARWRRAAWASAARSLEEVYGESGASRSALKKRLRSRLTWLACRWAPITVSPGSCRWSSLSSSGSALDGSGRHGKLSFAPSKDRSLTTELCSAMELSEAFRLPSSPVSVDFECLTPFLHPSFRRLRRSSSGGTLGVCGRSDGEQVSLLSVSPALVDDLAGADSRSQCSRARRLPSFNSLQESPFPSSARGFPVTNDCGLHRMPKRGERFISSWGTSEVLSSTCSSRLLPRQLPSRSPSSRLSELKFFSRPSNPFPSPSHSLCVFSFRLSSNRR